ncbi:MAG: SpoIID/LytB domain-containing protein [Deltaproteobacteria bacterium]|nr:SpoIID/LytB domain-containing protein [Deltaproteobacteria bacterium]
MAAVSPLGVFLPLDARAWDLLLPPQVSVRLRPLKGRISISGMELRVSDQNSAQVLKVRGYDRLHVAYQNSAWQFSDAATSEVLLKIPGKQIEVSGENLRVDLRPAPDRIRLVAGERENLPANLVGLLTLEDYVEGVVSAEVPRDWPLEALKAQAVAARSFTLAKIRERGVRADRWQLEASVMDQVFDHSRRHEMAARAVRETRGQYLAAIENRVVTTHYHSDCGGQTDEPRDVWGGGDALGTAKDMCPNRPGTNWRLVTSLGEITAILKKEALIQNSFRVSALNIEKRSPAGRAQVVRLAGEKGQSLRLSGEKMRSLLGYMNLRSTLFEIKAASATRIEFQGRGFGHGTGLCQWGARAMAQNAKSYQEILAHYYPKLTLSKGAR